MLTDYEVKQLTAVAAMSAHHGSYQYLCDTGHWAFLSHRPIGHVLYEFPPTP